MRIKTTLGGIAVAVAAATLVATPALVKAADAGVLEFTTGRAAATVTYGPQPAGQPYTFDTQAGNCTLAEESNPLKDACSVSSSGTFQNVVCGTGIVTGDPTDITALSGQNTVHAGNGYKIVFAGGVGVLAATGVTEDNQSGSGAAGGVVIIRPAPSSEFLSPVPLENSPAGGTGAVCTDGFIVTAALTAAA